MSITFLRIAREGWFLILLMAALSFAVNYWQGPLYAALPALGTLYLLMFFYEPERKIPPRALGVVSPVDGRVTEVLECTDPYLKRPARRVSIKVDHLGAYYLRSPSEGQVFELPAEGRAKPAGYRASAIRTDEGDEVLFVVRKGLLFGVRPCSLYRYGERIGQGRRCGPRRWADRINIYVPSDSRTDIKEGDKVMAGQDVLATLLRKRQNDTDVAEDSNEKNAE